MNLKVLIVDDEENIRSSLIRNLRKWANINLVDLEEAGSAKEALEFLKSEHENTALIISDNKMPELSGTDFLKKVASTYPKIMRIMLTGHADISSMGDLITAGICAFIEKPWDGLILHSEIAKALELYKLREFSEQQDKIQKEELEIAQDFQESFFQIEIPKSKNFNFHLHHQAASERNFGGDYYDIISFGNERYLILLGDVSGHSLRASFLAAILKAYIYSDFLVKHKTTEVSPASFLTWLNDKVFKLLQKTPGVFLGFSASYIDGNAGTVTLANGGLPASLLVTKNGVMEACPPMIPLGLEKHYVYNEQKFEMNKGDLLFICTDGILPSGKITRYINKTVFYELLKEMRMTQSGPQMLIKTATATETSLLEDDVTMVSVLMN
jgi:sigma-B regulation protein RsbU (phosphoserine phosphatase)